MKIWKPLSQKLPNADQVGWVFMRLAQLFLAVTVAFFIWFVLWMRADTTKMYADKAVFDKECLAAGNHLESGTGRGREYYYECRKGPEAELVKVFR